MSEPLPSTSWRYFAAATSRFASLRGYVSPRSTQQFSKRQPPSRSASPSPSASPRPVKESQPSWSQWAGQKIRNRWQGDSSSGTIVESVSVFPGWATRRPRLPSQDSKSDEGSAAPAAFDIEVYLSGYASSKRPPEFASRSQRAFIRLAKGFAGLSKLAADAALQPRMSRSTEELLAQKELPPPPSEISDDYEVQLLERQFWEGKKSFNKDSPSTAASSETDLTSTSDATRSYPELPRYKPSQAQKNNGAYDLVAADMRRFQLNLESRLQPFWSSCLASRAVRVSLYASMLHRKKHSEDQHHAASEYGPLAVEEVITAVDGSFQVKFDIRWEEICLHSQALQIAFDDSTYEHDLYAVAEILPPSSPHPSTSSLSLDSQGNPVNGGSQTARSRGVSVPPISQQPQARDRLSPYSPYPSPAPSVEHPQTFIRVPLTYSRLRVISDIDDTIKRSNILAGARAVFQAVFVRDLKETTIPGMGAWYTDMWNKGVRFHYVSNGPFELLPVVNEFMEISKLPPGSIKLKSYSGRSLFNGLMSDAATRKRAGVQHVLEAFPDSRFILIGDSGEQDLELYAELAKELPNQVIAVLIRDVEDDMDPISDPTGQQASESSLPLSDANNNGAVDSRRRNTDPLFSASRSTPAVTMTPRTADSAATTTLPDYISKGALNAEPEAMNYKEKRSATDPQSLEIVRDAAADRLRFSQISTSVGRKTSSTGSPSRSSSLNSPAMTQAEKRRYELQLRVWKARKEVPPEVALRIFREPQDCKSEMDAAGLDLCWS